MGGTGNSGGSGPPAKPDKLWQDVRSIAVNQVAKAEYKTDVSDLFASLLAFYNQRDHETIRQAIDDLAQALNNSAEGDIDLLFGGSVAKHTYVNGLSDVDLLAFFDFEQFKDETPENLRELIAGAIQAQIGSPLKIGRMCVTVIHRDHELQVLPVLKDGDITYVPDERGSEWRKVDAKAFSSLLTDVNKNMGGRLVPLIKLAKSLIADLPASKQLSGYHVEALAVEAFSKGAEGGWNDLLRQFFIFASDRILKPMSERTGQTSYIDDDLGDQNSLKRQIVSDGLDAIARKMTLAENGGSLDAWQDLFKVQLRRYGTKRD